MKKENNQFINKKNIRVFISSTFKDLANERNYLLRKTFPKLHDTALKYGVSITELDLRWGITNDESKLGKVLQICLEEVDNAVPFFIGIIGKRYGWIPSITDINPQVLELFPQVKEFLNNGISITEMEIMYGVITRQDNMHALFFVSDDEPDSSIEPVEYEKLTKLRELVINNGTYPVYRFKTPEDISSKVDAFFLNMLDKYFSVEPQSSVDIELNSHQFYAKSLISHFINNETYANYMYNWFNSSENLILIQGESGIGKSTFLANWATNVLDQTSKETIVITQFVGYGENHCSGDYIKNVLYQKLSQYFKLESDLSIQSNDIDDQLSSIIKYASEQYQIIIVIDGINQIAEDDKKSFLKWIPFDDLNTVKIAMSSITNDTLANKLIANGSNVLNIMPMSPVEKQNFITKYLSKKAKKLDQRSIKTILESKIFDNTMALRVLLETTILFSDNVSINKDIIRYTECSSLSDFYQKTLSEIDKEFSYELLQMVFALLFVSSNGLYENEIIELCETIPIIWKQVFRLVKLFLNEENGRIRLAHSHIEKAVEKHYLNSDIALIADYRKKLINYMEKKELIRSRNELPFLYVEHQMLQSLYNYLLNYDIASYYLEYNPIAFAGFWKKIHGQSCSHSIVDYLDLSDIYRQEFLPLLGNFCKDYLQDYNSAKAIFENNLAHSQKANIEFSKIMENITEGIEGAEIIEMPDWLRYGGSYCNLGNVEYDEGRYEEALFYYFKAIGLTPDKKYYYDIAKLSKMCDHIRLYDYDDREYFKLSYAFYRLGSTYDDLGYQDIACLMYKSSEGYLKSTNGNNNLLSEIYHNWAISLADFDPHKSISLLELSIDINRENVGNHHEDIPKALCTMGAIYRDKLDEPLKALQCYNEAINIDDTLGREDSVLGDLFINRSLIWNDLERKIKDILKAMIIYQKGGYMRQLINAHEHMAIAYYNKQDYLNALFYYLISYNYSYFQFGDTDNKTIFLEQEVLESLQIVSELNQLDLTNERFSYLLSIFLQRKEIIKLNSSDIQTMIEFCVGKLFNMVYAENEDGNEDDYSKEEIYRNMFFILHEIISYYETYRSLPVIGKLYIEALIYIIYNNEDFYKIVLDFINKTDVKHWIEYDCDKLIKWEALCFFLYIQNSFSPLKTNELMRSINMLDQMNVRSEFINSETVLEPSILYMLNSFIYYNYIPQGDFGVALETIEFILTKVPDDPCYIDTKAEVLYRMGKSLDALNLVNSIRLKNPSFYPEGNEFLYKALIMKEE